LYILEQQNLTSADQPSIFSRFGEKVEEEEKKRGCPGAQKENDVHLKEAPGGRPDNE